MKVFHAVESYTPSSNGMQEVVKRVSEHLSSRDFEVVVGTSRHPDREPDVVLSGVRVVSFEIKGNEAQGYCASSREIVRYIEFVKTSSFDVVVLFAAQQWATDILLPYLEEIGSKIIFVPTGFSGLYDQTYHDYYRELRKRLSLFDLCILHSKTYRDVEFIRSAGISRYVTIPNGASSDEFQIPREKPARKELSIVTVGSHSGFKGHVESVRIMDRARLQNVTLSIVAGPLGENIHEDEHGGVVRWLISVARRAFGQGRSCPDFCREAEKKWNRKLSWRLSRKRVEIKTLSREKLLELLKQADVFLFPSRIECSPIVLYEACAAGVPFIASDVGNAKEIAEWTGGGVIVDSTRDSLGYVSVDQRKAARALELLGRDAALRQQIGNKGRDAWAKEFTWERIVGLYEDEYRKCIGP